MNTPKKPSRADLLRTLEEVQRLVGVAAGAAENDRSPDRMRDTRAALDEAFALCVAARSFDPPRRPASKS